MKEFNHIESDYRKLVTPLMDLEGTKSIQEVLQHDKAPWVSWLN